MEDRVIDLEIRLAYQDKKAGELEELVRAMAFRLDSVERELAELAGFDAQKSPGKIEQAFARISDVLLPPSLLPEDSTAVEIVAEGRIASVPFAGLQSPKDPARRLIETHAVTMITSAPAMSA